MSAKTILIVDDEPHIRFMLQMKFSEAGYTVLTAPEGDRAFQIARQERPALVITDLQMPGTDGMELCRRLAEHAATASVPVIMLTARGHRIPADELARTNIVRLHDKPFSITELMRSADEVQTRPASAPGANAA